MKKECVNCGVKNDTVDKVPDIDVYLCDYCFGTKVEGIMSPEEVKEEWG